LTADIVRLATQYGRYGYRRIRKMLVDAGWSVSVKRVYRIWRREGLKVPKKQPKRGRLWLNDGSCVRLRPERPNHVWSYDFVQDRTEDGRAFRMLVVLDEFTRRCLAVVVARRLRSDDVLHCLADLFVAHGPPEHLRSDNGPEFVAQNVRQWLGRIGVKTLYIEPGSPWENGYCESLNSKLRDELLNVEIFTTLREAQVLIEAWRPALQCCATAFLAWLSTPSSGSDLAATIRSALRCAPASREAGRARPGSNLDPGIVMRGRPHDISVMVSHISAL
jgi:putative transposase